jgi:transposase-like protein
MRKRRTAKQWQEILARQIEAGLTDAQVAVENDVNVSTLRLWRQKLNKLNGLQPLVEVTPRLARGELKVHLPNGLILGVSGDWPIDQLAAVVRLLRAL